jgi:hypothetical protein
VPVLRAVLTRLSAPQTEEDVDLVVCDLGLLLLPVLARPPASGRRSRKSGPEKRAETERAETLMEGSFAGLRARPGAGWLRAEDILGARLRKRPKWLLTLDLPDGEPLVLQAHPLTTDLGGAADALSGLLGPRLQR